MNPCIDISSKQITKLTEVENIYYFQLKSLSELLHTHNKNAIESTHLRIQNLLNSTDSFNILKNIKKEMSLQMLEYQDLILAAYQLGFDAGVEVENLESLTSKNSLTNDAIKNLGIKNENAITSLVETISNVM